MAGRFSTVELMRELGVRLLREQYLTQTELTEATEHAALLGTKLDRLLISEHIVEEAVVLKTLSAITGIPFARLADRKIQPEALEVIPMRTALHYQLVPVGLVNNRLTLACDRVPEVTDEESLQALLGCSIRWILCPARDVSEAIKHFYGLGADLLQNIMAAHDEHNGDRRSHAHAAVEGATMTPLVTAFIHEAIQMRASDIHLEPFDHRLRLRYRVDGVMQDIPLPRGIDAFGRALVSCIKVMAQLDISKRRQPHDGRIGIVVDGEEHDIRVSILPTHFGEAVNMRILSRQSGLVDFKELGLRADQRKAMEALTRLPHGLVLITGPTGSGKTTTLYATLEKMKTAETTIITLEDPIEYQINDIVQIQLNPKVGLDFAHGLRAVLRHDPDIILVGEIRDKETTDIAIRSSLTGHMVFSTLHTNDAADAIIRLVDMGIEPYLVASSLEGVIAQRLVRRICNACRTACQIDDEIVRQVREVFPDIDNDVTFYHGRGCPDCKFTGYSGRAAVFEIMPVDESMKALIVRRALGSEVRQHASRAGMTSLRNNAWRLALEGITTVDDVMRVTRRPDDMPLVSP